ncbi:hypothetical protein LBMAG53_35570 [Planctomycetota bacterium]|nr:hypothetical protein LBMAG53_35570 [Planctomycetota bacterium]
MAGDDAERSIRIVAGGMGRPRRPMGKRASLQGDPLTAQPHPTVTSYDQEPHLIRHRSDGNGPARRALPEERTDQFDPGLIKNLPNFRG